MKYTRISIIVLLVSLVVAGKAQAHRVNVFAWTEGDIVYVESKFSGGKKVSGGKIIVTDSSGVELFTGRTNDRGEISFERPQPAELKITLEAGMGHRAEWTLPVSDGYADQPADQIPSENVNARDRQKTPKTPAAADERPAAPATAVYTGPSRAEIQALVENALDKKMKPMLEMLAQSRAQGPGIGDILGGIGYIIGLVGIAAYFHNRKKKK